MPVFPNKIESKLIGDIIDSARRLPKHIAVQFNEIKYSYGELHTESNKIAHWMLANDIGKGDVIGIALDRSPEILLCILAVLKCGAAYTPIDPFYPKSRIEFMATDANVKFLITSNEFENRVTVLIQKMMIKDVLSKASSYSSDAPDIEYFEDDLAYILYTSGSTGTPKGALVTQGNLVHFLKGMQHVFQITAADKFISVSSVSFDASCYDYYLSLTHGATLILTDNATARDGKLLLDDVEKKGASIMLATPVSYKLMLQAGWNEQLPVTLLSAGEPLPPTLAKELLPRCKALYNVYGPTETTVICVLTRITDPNDITIGFPIIDTTLYFLDEHQKPVEEGAVGEICIGGKGVSLGYLNRPELTREKFMPDPFAKLAEARIYRSGDLGRKRSDGAIEYLGRIDDQVKIRGYRIELGEIEHRIANCTGVKEVVVVAREDRTGEKRLVAYIVPGDAVKNNALLISTIKEDLKETLPLFMVPEHFVFMEHFPISPNGKIAKNKLPELSTSRPDLQSLLEKPKSKIEQELADVWGHVLQIDALGINDNFFELGGNSLFAQKAISLAAEKYGYQIPITKHYQFPTIKEQQHFLTGTHKTKKEIPIKRVSRKEGTIDIAVIGMECNFPGATTVSEFWEVIAQGKETISFFTEDEIDGNIPNAVKNDPLYVKARGVLTDVDTFDASLFGLSPKLVELMDPQQRLFLETSRNLLEKCGYLPEKTELVTGVFAGCNTNTYFNNNVIWHKEEIEIQGAIPVSTVNDKDYISSRVAYQLNLNGPAVNINTACSTSLVAVAQAVESLRNGQCDIAIAGGASVTVPVKSGHLYQEGSMLSADGHCRPFDAFATGTVFSDGVGAVLLKTVEQAKKDGDIIYAVIKGVGVNNDGGNKGSFTAPSAEGQATAIKMAIEEASIQADQISYIEAHGTATPLGDPIEIEGLRMAFGETSKKQYCALGSLKGNMGHLTHAAGIAGLMKTVLALYYKKLPPTIHFKKANSAIDFLHSPYYVNAALKDWEHNTKRIAGVSSFGVGGTNCHIIVEEFSVVQPEKTETGTDTIPQLITWSARDKESFEAYAKKLSAFIQENPKIPLGSIAYTLYKTRQEFNYRGALVATDPEELQVQLNSIDKLNASAYQLKEKENNVVFLFPGQGSQYVNMGRELYQVLPVYKAAIDECAAILLQETGEDIREVLFPEEANDAATEKIKSTKYAQPCIFSTSYAIAKLFMSWGVQPAAFAGHSIGEFVGAHLSGIFSLVDVLKIITARARLISELPGGSMLSVRSSPDVITPLLPASLSVAAHNAPGLCVVSGDIESINHFSTFLTSQQIINRILRTSHGFHSKMMDPVIAPLKAVVDSVQKHIPKIPVLSTVTGNWLRDKEALSSAYWANHARVPVNFSGALQVIYKDLKSLFLEVGPGTTSIIFAKQQSSEMGARAFASLDTSSKPEKEIVAVKKALGNLWLHGAGIDMNKLVEQKQQSILHELPTYAYHKQRYWVDPPASSTNERFERSTFVSELPSITLTTPKMERKEMLIDKIREIIEAASGISVADANPHHNFTEMGLDSLLLTQLVSSLKKEFSIPVTFRQLSEDYDSLDKLAVFFDINLPENACRQEPVVPAVNGSKANSIVPANHSQAVSAFNPGHSGAGDMLDLITQQLQVLTQQVALLQAGNTTTSFTPLKNIGTNGNHSEQFREDLTAEEKVEFKKPFGATAKIEKKATDITEQQQQYLKEFIESYNKKTAASKKYTQDHRKKMADPRVVSGFKPFLKEMVYSLVMKKSKGCYLWDIDDNKYIDALNGFGSNFLGYQPDVLKNAILKQVEDGYEIGPQHVLAGEVSDLICEMTGMDRVGLCNTGSEAILGAMRIARTVTSKDIIVAFTGSYHGIIDEVLVRGSKKLKTYPAASGILAANVQNMLILEYGSNEALQVIKEKAADIAGVLVEPVQSRRPEFQPIEFLKELRAITQKNDIALIFDEVITGFRSHPGGTQALFGIKADLAAYGKVVGGGLSIGVIAGSDKYMDALDGGFWEYGNSSIPEVGVTYFAGTFVRHPLALATAYATLKYLKEQGPILQEQLNQKTKTLTRRLNEITEKHRVPIYVVHFSSLWKIKFREEYPYFEMLFALMRNCNIHIWDGFPCFLTTAHEQEDIETICLAFEESILELLKLKFIPQAQQLENKSNLILDRSRPPVSGARLGMDKEGNPAWFIEDDKNPGKYLQVNL